MLMIRFFIVIYFIFFSCLLFSQEKIDDTALRLIGAQANISYEFPGGDLAQRFGSNANVGGGLFYKSKRNFIFLLEGNYFFGEHIKEDSLFHLIKNPNGYIIDGDGMYADVRTYERGYTLMGKAGKIFNIFDDNPNSGVILMMGAGFMQHKIRIENPGQTVAQLKDDYKKGYDKLSNGPALSQFIGYVHYSENRVTNYRIGFEFTQAFTKARRNYDFDLMKKDDRARIDLMYGLKISWMLPFRKRTPREFYYN